MFRGRLSLFAVELRIIPLICGTSTDSGVLSGVGTLTTSLPKTERPACRRPLKVLGGDIQPPAVTVLAQQPCPKWGFDFKKSVYLAPIDFGPKPSEEK